MPGPEISLANRGAGTVDHRIRRGLIGRGKTDAAEFIACRACSALHCAGGGSASGAAARRSVRAAISACFSARRCNCQTPRPTNSATIDKRENAKAGDAAAVLRNSRSFRLAIDQPAFRGLVMELQRDQQRLHRAQRQQRGRQGSAAATDAACTQNGGWYLTSTISAQPTTMAPAIMMMKTPGRRRHR